MVGQLVLPQFYTLYIRELGVIYPHTVAENVTETGGNLSGQRNFGQEIQNLLALSERLLDEMDIDFSLAAGRNAVEQADIFFFKNLLDLVESPLLLLGQRLRSAQLAGPFVVRGRNV